MNINSLEAEMENELTEEELNKQAQECVELSSKLNDVLHGNDLDVCMVVLMRTLIQCAYVSEVSPQRFLTRVLVMTKEVYGGKDDVEGTLQ